ncbi:phoenix [Stegastes partitus]|uniref:Phoenix n=1 Tax=Stegastes partitus TaxID=144197 RepID=A0A9Y4N6T2_9TELE|nr:PREDICTED: glutamic acid-rich protein-like [Stegastes partitus]
MTQMSLTGTQSDLFTDSGNPHTDLDTLPPGNGDELWQHVEVGQKDGAPAETDSDSGDSLFITQKPVAEAVRSGRRSRRSSFSPGSPSDTDAERSDDSASPEKSETDKKKTPKKLKRPKYSFSFLRQSKITGRMCVGELKAKQNTELQNAAMGGFFKCARDMWQNYPTKEDLESALPTVDMPGESIHPISEEEEEERPEDEDIKVVEKKRFVVSLKAKSSQPWPEGDVGITEVEETPSLTQTIDELEIHGKGSEEIDNMMTLEEDVPDANIKEKKNKLAEEDVREEEEGHLESDVRVEEEDSESCNAEKKSDEDADLLNSNLQSKPLNDVAEKPRKKKKKDKLAAEDVREENNGHLESDVRVEEEDSDRCDTENAGEKKNDEDVDLLKSNLQSKPLNDVAEKLKKKKNKKKKNKLAAEDVGEEEEGHLKSDGRVEEESVSLESCDAENGSEKKSDEDVDLLTSSLQSEPLINVAEKLKKKKKKKKNKLAVEDGGQEEEGHLESDTRVEEEDSVFSDRCITENGSKKKSDEDVDLLNFSLQSEPLYDVAEKPKKKKKKKNKLAAEDGRQEGEEGHLESDVRVEEQDSESCITENGDEKKSDEDVDLLTSSLQSEPLNDVAEKPKKKKKTKLAVEDVREEEEGHLESDVRVEEEDSVFSDRCDAEDGGEKKSDEDVDSLKSNLQSEPLSDVAEKPKKKKKKNKLAAEYVRHEGEEGHLESDVRTEEESVFLESCDTENGGEKKSDEDIDSLKSNLHAKPLNDVAEKPKRKKKKKTKLAAEDVRQEGDEGHLELDVRVEEQDSVFSDRCDAENGGEKKSDEDVSVKRKKKKKQKSASVDDDAPIGRDDCIDESFSKEVITESPVQKKKKKKKKEKTEDENVGGAQETTEGGEDQDAGLVGTITNNDTVTQNDDSVRKKKRTRSFLVADAEETAAQTHQETQSGAADKPAGESAETAGSWMGSDDGVRKKKKKRKKVSAERERVEKDHELDFEEPNTTCLVVETGLKRKKKRKMDEEVASVEKSERDSQTDENVGSKKKRKKKIPPTTAENNESEEATLNVSVSLSNKKKSQTVAAKGLNDTCNDGSAADDRTTREALAERASPSPETPGNQPLNDVKGKKKRKKVKESDTVSLEAKSFTEIEAHKPKKNRRETESSFSPVFSDTSLSQCEPSSSLSIRKKKHKKSKAETLQSH